MFKSSNVFITQKKIMVSLFSFLFLIIFGNGIFAGAIGTKLVDGHGSTVYKVDGNIIKDSHGRTVLKIDGFCSASIAAILAYRCV